MVWRPVSSVVLLRGEDAPRCFNGDTNRTVIVAALADCPSNEHYKCGWKRKALCFNFTVLGSEYSAVYHRRWSHFNLGWKANGNCHSGTFFIQQKAAWKQPVWVAVECKMNCKQLLLLCFLYRCSSDEFHAIIIKHCLVVPARLSLGWLAALPVAHSGEGAILILFAVVLMIPSYVGKGQLSRDAKHLQLPFTSESLRI